MTRSSTQHCKSEMAESTGSAEGDLPEYAPTKKPRSSAKKASDKERNKTRINIGLAFPRWRALRAAKRLQLDSELAFLLLDTFSRFSRFSRARGNPARVNIGVALPRWTELRDKLGLQRDADLACVLLDSYLQTKSENRLEQPTFERSSSTETCDSVDCEYPFMMSSPSEAERETCADPSIHSSENEKESGEKDAGCQSVKSEDEWTTTNLSENKENGDIQEDEDEEFSTSLSVGDGHYLVDMGSLSELVVDEECILQLFKSCRECNRQCTVRKHVKGLKLVVYQACCFCQSHRKWSNLPDDDDGDFQINGKDAAQTNSATSPSSNSS